MANEKFYYKTLSYSNAMLCRNFTAFRLLLFEFCEQNITLVKFLNYIKLLIEEIEKWGTVSRKTWHYITTDCMCVR